MSNDNDATVAKLVEFCVASYPRAREIDLTPDHALLEEGIVDSLGILRLVNFIEDTFGILIAEEDFDPENFTSIRTISRFVERKQG